MLKYIKELSFFKKVPCDIFSINWDPLNGYLPINPSICSFKEKLFLSIRTFKFLSSIDGWSIDSINYLLQLDPKDFNVLSLKKIFYPELPNRSFKNTVTGFEDPRLFVWKDDLWTISTCRQLYDDNLHRMVLSKVEPYKEDYTFSDWTDILPSHGIKRHEKNWMPVIKDNNLFFIYSHNPFIVLDHCGNVVINQRKKVPSQFRGGTQLVPFFDGYISLIHERLGKASYCHRFVYYNQNLILEKFSDPFYFLKNDIEFAAGICYDVSKDNFLVSFGFKDKFSKLARLKVDCVKDFLVHAVD